MTMAKIQKENNLNKQIREKLSALEVERGNMCAR